MRRFIISAAGMGSRLGLDMPKCLLPIYQARLIDFQLATLPAGCDVRIVVGYHELDVIEYVTKRWPNVTFVRNPSYATTSNSYSLYLATRHLTDPFFSIDGDILIDPETFAKFLEYCDHSTGTVVGYTRMTTQESVGVRLDEHGQILEFVRTGSPGHDQCEFEWCGIAYFKNFAVEPNQRFVFEELAKHLPLPGFEIHCSEIDTPEDLATALKIFPAAPVSLYWE
jgi:choline kinase